MLSPSEDRVDYTTVLQPPEGFRLVRAVATTYSLDFQTLIAALIPLGLRGSIDDEEMHNPIAQLQAIRKVTDKLVVFCEAGQIKVPGKQSRLLTLLDDIVVQMALPRKKGAYPSFHPKTWTIEYANDRGDHVWRFVVLSRNLTTDKSWDVSVVFDGEHKRGATGQTKNLVAFLEFLRGRVYKGAGTDRQKRVVERLIASLDGVSFDVGSPFEDFSFHPFGINGQEPDVFHLDEVMDDRMVISPFLSERLLARLNDTKGESAQKTRILITRAESLAAIPVDAVSHFRKFILRETHDEDGSAHDLHAKMYLWRRGSRAELWIGSANATNSGFERNVEMLVRLTCANRYLNAEKLLSDICGGAVGSTSLLEEVSELDAELIEADAEEEARQRAESLIRDICRLKMMATVAPEGERYRITLSVEAGDVPRGARIWPVNSPGNVRELSRRLDFPMSLELADLSTLYVVSVAYDGTKSIDRILKIETVGLPESRNEAVLNDIVRNKPALLRYLLMLLSANPALPLRRLGEIEQALEGEGASRLTAERLLPGLYEEMLVAAARDPERLKEAGFVLGRLGGDDACLAEYRKLYRPFAEALKIPLQVEARHV